MVNGILFCLLKTAVRSYKNNFLIVCEHACFFTLHGGYTVKRFISFFSLTLLFHFNHLVYIHVLALNNLKLFYMKKISVLICICLVSYFKIMAQQWTPQVSNIDPNNYVQFIDAVDTNIVWGLTSARAGQTIPVQEFTRTVNGGSTWVAGTINNAVNHGPSSIMALNADTAWVAMFNVSGGGTILRTDDGGANWTPQTTATFAAPGGFPNIVHFFDANDGICMGDPNGGYFEIYTTNNGGTNWVRVPQANIPANQAGEFGITDVFTSFGDSTLYFGTNQGRIYKSLDRGQSWTVASTPYTGFLGAITFKDVNLHCL